ncbi:MAG: Asp23/Gls24 family envelope stress response protein [Anaerolineae bacterium]|nr:Asp23/Gls24 family envelope stress response protein [Anaerolineae bacterium]MDK1079860.1 Asp23/Gls24 family envelope stress response protein [Anaerolineae bacterium]MDK1119284.1 Asp23/Gls24 family envelope stress response protein [Anaerolineae bacterium]
MGKETISLGRIHISLNAITTIAYHAALESYGVIGLAHKNLAQGLVNTLTREPTRGVSVNHENEELNIDIYIILEYGTRISTVANNVVNTVRYHVEKALDLPVNNINVHITGLRVSDTD